MGACGSRAEPAYVVPDCASETEIPDSGTPVSIVGGKISLCGRQGMDARARASVSAPRNGQGALSLSSRVLWIQHLVL